MLLEIILGLGRKLHIRACSEPRFCSLFPVPLVWGAMIIMVIDNVVDIHFPVS